MNIAFRLVRKFKNRRRQVIKLYRIPGTRYFTRDHSYFKTDTYPLFQTEYEKFKRLLVNLVAANRSATFFKFGDGDYYFLAGKEVGSAKPGSRAISKQYSEINLEEFQEDSKKNDYYTCEIANNNQNLFRQSFPDIIPDFPAEFTYGIISNRWVIKEFAGKIGLIGAEPKLRIIKELLRSNTYRNFLGIDSFEDYIYVPQKYACDNLEGVKRSVQEQLKNAKSNIFLLGVGHVKSGLLQALPSYHNAVYLDVGSGIDALAGMVDPKRPYFEDWINYTLRDSSLYEGIDYLQFDGDNRRYID